MLLSDFRKLHFTLSDRMLEIVKMVAFLEASDDRDYLRDFDRLHSSALDEKSAKKVQICQSAYKFYCDEDLLRGYAAPEISW